MVSALYQRRALHHPEHFVFGICHTHDTRVDVIAATWKAIEPPTGNQNAGATGDSANASTSKVTLEIESYFLAQLDLARPIDLVRLYLIVLATIPLAKDYRRQLIDDPPIEPAPDFKGWADDMTWTSKSRTSDTHTSCSKRQRLADVESPGGGDLTGATGPGHVLSLGDSPSKYGVPKRKLGDIERLPEMSSYYKCLRYVQSLPS
ncbi:hypothetical protein FRC10_006773 [Ceratobasidium sp. 414]|nr:hypothetical protein FRC10_006773 [Ceratobasidium sp. 414]